MNGMLIEKMHVVGLFIDCQKPDSRDSQPAVSTLLSHHLL